MPRSTRSPQGFTAIEILVVLAVVGILAGTGYAAAGHYRARAAEAEMRQDLVHFVNQQQVLRQRTGSLGTLAQLDSLGFRRSPGVVVEENRVEGAGRRAYLRVRHLGTGQRCSVDYSPFVSNALNRVQCWAGPDDPSATEGPAPGELAGPAPVATVPVDTPSTAVPPARCQSGYSPTVDAPADQNLRPGLAGSGVFTLRNPAPDERTYSLAFSSSNPAVVPSSTGPTSVTVPAGGSRSITTSFQVDPAAEAGQVSVLPLEATDAACTSLVANGFFSVATELVLGPLELSDPADRTSGAEVPIPVDWISTSRTNQRRMMMLEAREDPGLTRSGAAPGRASYAQGDPHTTRVTYTLSNSVDGFESRTACMKFYDFEAGPAHPMTRDQCFTATAAFVPGRPQVVVPTSREAGQSEEFSTEWTVVNTSNARRLFNISAESTGDLQLVSAAGAGAGVAIARGGAHVVRATYRLNRPSIAGTRSFGKLQVADADRQYVPPSFARDSFTVATKLEVCAPFVAGAPADRAELPGAGFTATWQLRNCTNAPRTLTLAPAGDTDVIAQGGARMEVFAAFEERSVSLAYQMKERSVYQTRSNPTLRASDADFTTPSGFGVTTALKLCAPAMTGPVSGAPPQPQLPATGARVGYTVENCSNSPRRFSYRGASSNPGAAVVTGASPDAEIPAYGTGTGYVSYAVPELALGRSTAVVTLAASDPGAGETSRALPIEVAVVTVAPAVSFPSGQTVKPGASESNTASIRNGSNIDVRVCYQARAAAGNVAAPQVVASQSAPDCQTVPAFGTTSAMVRYQLADPPLQGWTNQVVLNAYDSEPSRTHLASEGAFTVTTDLVVRPAAARWLSGLDRWRVEEDRSHAFQITNQSNGTRYLCYVYGSDDVGIVSPKGGPGEPNCDLSIAAGASIDLGERLFSGISDSGDELKDIWVRVWDRDTGTSTEGYGRKGVVIKPRFDPVPIACYKHDKRWTHQWISFDATCSGTNGGSPIVAYEWDWDMPGASWSEAEKKFVSGGNGFETVSVPTVERAWDASGTYSICLVVINQTGKRSPRYCGPASIDLHVEVRARLRARFQSWWAQYVGDDKGHARWEYSFSASQGGLGIKRASVVQLTDFATPGGGDPFKQYDYTYVSDKNPTEVQSKCGAGTYWDYPAARWCYEYTGRMRIAFGVPLTGPVGEYNAAHGLYSNEGLGQKERTGRQPDVAPIRSVMILEIVDGEDNVTADTLYYGHYDGDDRPSHYNYEPWDDDDRRYRTTDWINFGPNHSPGRLGTMPTLVQVDNGDGTFRFSAQGGVSRDGRVMVHGVYVVYDPGTREEETDVYMGPTYTIGSPQGCGYYRVTPYWTDNFGRNRWGSEVTLGTTDCEEPPIRTPAEAL